MKRSKFLLVISLFMMMAFALAKNVNALATREEMLKYIPEDILDSLTKEQYAKYQTLDFSRAQVVTKTFTDHHFPEEIAPQSGTVNTNYKTLSLMVVPFGSKNIDYYVSLDLQWKYIPAVRSYDVIALRFDNMVMNGPSIIGVQSYALSNGDKDAVNYSYLGKNMNYENDGFGISMNVVNDKLNDLHMYISLDTAIASSTATVYGAYEHAVDNVSLAQSKNYTISAVGMGRVINFVDSVWQHYDDMDGVKVTVPYK